MVDRVASLHVTKKYVRRTRNVEFLAASSSIDRGVPTGETFEDYGVKKRVKRIKGVWKNNQGFILDLGCGYGAYTKVFAEDAILAVGLDVERNFLKRAKEKNSGDNIEFILASGDFLPFTDEAFNSVFLIETLEHVLNDEKS